MGWDGMGDYFPRFSFQGYINHIDSGHKTRYIQPSEILQPPSGGGGGNKNK